MSAQPSIFLFFFHPIFLPLFRGVAWQQARICGVVFFYMFHPCFHSVGPASYNHQMRPTFDIFYCSTDFFYGYVVHERHIHSFYVTRKQKTSNSGSSLCRGAVCVSHMESRVASDVQETAWASVVPAEEVAVQADMTFFTCVLPHPPPNNVLSNGLQSLGSSHLFLFCFV